MGNFDDGAYIVSLGEAMRTAPRVSTAIPEKPAWKHEHIVYTSELGSITELLCLEDRITHVQTAGLCFVWNYVNQSHERGWRLFSYRSPDGYARVSIQCRTLDDCISGKGRCYMGYWRAEAEKNGVRELNGEPLVLVDYAGSFAYGNAAIDQAHITMMEADVRKWWTSLPSCELPPETDVEKSRKVTRR